MENNPHGHLLKVFVCLFLYLESNQVIILGKVSKGIKKIRNLIFYPKMDLGFEIQKTNFGIRIRILEIPCVPIFRQNGQIWLFGLIWPKIGFWFEILKVDVEIKISILEIPCVPISRQNRQLCLFEPKFAQKWILGLEFQKSNSRFRITTSKIPCVPIFSQNGQHWVFRPKFGEITQLRAIFSFEYCWECCRELAGSWNELSGGGWIWVELNGGGWSWVDLGARFNNTHFIKSQCNLLFNGLRFSHLHFFIFISVSVFEAYIFIWFFSQGDFIEKTRGIHFNHGFENSMTSFFIKATLNWKFLKIKPTATGPLGRENSK